MPCDMCGKEDKLVTAEIEGVKLSVCSGCRRYGKVLYNPKREMSQIKKLADKHIKEEPEIKEIVADNYGEIIRKKREKMGLKQKEFAILLKEKESLLQNIENGRFRPSLDLARKLEKRLNIKIIEKYKETEFIDEKNKREQFTIGDMIKKN